MSNNINTNFNINNNINNGTINNNNNNYSSNQNLATNTNVNILNHLTNESHLFESFSTYKIICLEFISIFCNIKVSFKNYRKKYNN
jgi:hypothetical protein